MKNPKITFLDAASLDLGDLDMTSIRRQGRYVALDRCAKNKIPASVLDSHIVITNKVILNKKELSKFKNLKLICVSATGVNNVELKTARSLGIAVCNVAGYSTTTVVEHTLMFLLALSHRLLEHHLASALGDWSRSPLFTLLDYPFSDLEGKTLGIIGYGNIGKRVAKLARALGMKVLIAKLPDRKYSATPKRTPLSGLLKQSDFVSLHCPLSDQTLGLMNSDRFKLMKSTAYLLNLARGPIVVEKDVVAALKKNKLAGYASDVAAQEPILKSSPLLDQSIAHKVLLTPHVAWASRESRQRLVNEIAENIAAFKKGKKRNRIY